MNKKFQNKYRIPSARHPYWDYSKNAAYFVTICTKNRNFYFGEIVNSRASGNRKIMELSKIGNIVGQEWLKTPEIRPDMNLELGPYVVMPNHFHGTIIIGPNQYNDPRRDAMHRVSSMKMTNENLEYKNKFGPQSKNLSSIIRGFKSAVTIQARKIQPDFAWQSRFHDHIIRNDASYKNIKTYIETNPLNWSEDKFIR